MERRSFNAGLAAMGMLALCPALSACSRSDGAPLVVGTHPWPGYETLRLAEQFGWLNENIRLRYGRAATDSINALKSGQLDAACLTLDEVLYCLAEGVPLAVGLVFDFSAGADVVLARASIRSVAELAGKRIGMERNAVGAFMLESMLGSVGMPMSDVVQVDCPPFRQLAAWREGSVDAVISYEPQVSGLLEAGAHEIFSSKEIPETILDVLAVRMDRMHGLSDSLRQLLAGHFRALHHIGVNRADAIYRMAANLAVAPHDVERGLGGLVLPSLSANVDYLSLPDGKVAQVSRHLADLMLHHGMLSQPVVLDKLSHSGWLPKEG